MPLSTVIKHVFSILSQSNQGGYSSSEMVLQTQIDPELGGVVAVGTEEDILTYNDYG